MSLNSFKKSIDNARKICEAAAPAAVVAELTSEMKPDTKFTFPSDGINLATLKMKIKSEADNNASIVDSGATVTITTSNPNAVTQVLRKLRVAGVEIGGDAFSTVDVPEVGNEGSVLLGESLLKRATSKMKRILAKG